MKEYIRTHCNPLLSIETGETPHLPPFKGIRAVVFDVYGTILISSCEESAPREAMELALRTAGLPGDAEFALVRYRELIKEQQEECRSRCGVEFPEVEIREVWSRLIEELFGDLGKVNQAAIVYECAANPVWPMDGLDTCLADLRSRGLLLGIVSNAQFYTRRHFPALLDASLEELGFEAEAMIFSYEVREAKPSRSLYARLARRLARRGIQPSQILYVGNDRLKDIWPAQREGFKTVLFAGDKRSLRWHRHDTRLTGIESDAIITKLAQIAQLIK